MSIYSRQFALAAVLLGCPWLAIAAEPARQIGVYVEPYYRSSETPSGRPQVAVNKNYDALLSSNRRSDILAARDLIAADPKLVTPMTLMVLAIRLYDVGLRDDAVFWFYVAKDRYLVMASVLDVHSPLLAQANDAVGSFATLAGPIINGYAFCDLAKQKAVRAKAVGWVESHPYEVMFMGRFPAAPGDRAENLRRGIADAKERAAKERIYVDDPNNLASMTAARKQNEADVKFCWK
jgi:hypothetical protein